MNKMDKALREIGEMDELAARSSPVHDLSAPAKLLSTIAYIITVVSFDKYDLSGLVPLLLWPVLLFDGQRHPRAHLLLQAAHRAAARDGGGAVQPAL